jgi:hypothetical protein
MLGSVAASFRRILLIRRITSATLEHRTPDAGAENDIEVTQEMIVAGENAILCEIGRAEGLGGYFSARELAVAVYQAMDTARRVTNSGIFPRRSSGFRPIAHTTRIHLSAACPSNGEHGDGPA